MKSTTKLKKERFAEMAVHTRCNAFEFESGYMYYEFHPDFSSKEKYPEFEPRTVEFEFDGEKRTTENVQGTFNYVFDRCIADLWFVLTSLEKQGTEFYTFWNNDGGDGRAGVDHLDSGRELNQPNPARHRSKTIIGC